MTNDETVKILEEEFPEHFMGISEESRGIYFLDYVAIDLWIFGGKKRHLTCTYKRIYEHIEDAFSWHDEETRNECLIKYLRENKHMIDFWKL